MRAWKRRWKFLENRKKLFGLIGLAARARKVVSGEFSTEKSVKSGKSHLVIVSEEASDVYNYVCLLQSSDCSVRYEG